MSGDTDFVGFYTATSNDCSILVFSSISSIFPLTVKVVDKFLNSSLTEDPFIVIANGALGVIEVVFGLLSKLSDD